MVSQAFNIAMRGLQFLWTLLIMALVGNMIASAFAGNPSIVNYDMFVAAFSMLSLFFLVPVTCRSDLGFPPLAVLGLDILNTVFFLCGGIAMAGYLNVHSCGNLYYTHSNSITNGSHDTEKRCREAQATTAFLWFGFAAYALSAFSSFMQGRDSSPRPSTTQSRPDMSQV